MASAEAIALAGGPVIDMVYGRVDAGKCPAEGNLPDALAPWKGEDSAATHLRRVFFRMGFSDQEIVALSGAHTLGRAFAERSGTTFNGYGSAKGTAYTNGSCPARADGAEGVGMVGGRSWTKNWLKFDNSYFKDSSKSGLLWLSTDNALTQDASFAPHFEKYAKDERAFFVDYCAAHKKLSELGSKWAVPGGVRIGASSRL